MNVPFLNWVPERLGHLKRRISLIHIFVMLLGFFKHFIFLY